METLEISAVQKRIIEVQEEIKSYKESIKCILYVNKKNEFLSKMPFSHRRIKYTCIPRSEKLFQWTMQNLKTQIQLLERELATLLKYF